MNTQPLVSIVTVVYNGEKYLKQTIESVIGQTYTNIEYIIIDGGSTDGTLSIIKQYEEHISYWVTEPDKGLYDAMNKGIGVASGALIGMINSDDWYEPTTVELVVEAYAHNPNCHIFHGDRYDILESGEKKLYKFNPSALKLMYFRMTFNHPSMFVTQEEYREHRYNSDLRSVADFQFVLEAFMKDRSKFCYIERPLSNYRLGGISAHLNRRDTLRESFLARKNAGFSLLPNIFSVLVRLASWVVKYFLKIFKKFQYAVRPSENV